MKDKIKRIVEIGKDIFLDREEKLKEKIKEDAKVFHSIVDPILIIDKEHHVINSNEAFLNLISKKQEEVIGKKCYGLVHGTDNPIEGCNSCKVFETQKTETFEFYHPELKKHLWISASPIIENDEVSKIVHHIRDITEKKKAEKLLFQSKVFEDSITANSIADDKGIIIHVNPFFLKTWGFKNKKEVIGKPILYFLQNKEEAVEIINTIDKTGKWEGNYTAKRKNGSNFIAYGLATTITDEKGDEIGYQSIVFDVTEKKKAEEELKKHREHLKELVDEHTAAFKKSEEKFKALFESSRDAIMTLSPPSWSFTSGNKSTVDMFRCKDEKDFISYAPFELSPEFQPDGKPSKTKALEMINKAVKEGSNFFEWVHKRANEEEFPATVLLTRVEIEKGKPFLQATVRDITEQKKAEEEINKKHEQLQKFAKLSIGREKKMMELKDKLKQLKNE